jgi:hypothetical protein
MFSALKDANFSPIEQLLAALIIVLALLVPWWIAALSAAALTVNGVMRLRAAVRAADGDE